MRAADLMRELYDGVVDGRRVAIEEAPHLAKVAGLKYPNYDALYREIEIRPMPPPILGATAITRKGDVLGIYVNKLIPHFVSLIAEKYRKGVDWARDMVYKIAKLTTEHELGHALSSRVAKGEKINKDTVNIMESISTYARHVVAKLLGKNKKAEFIKATNPYKKAWLIGYMADKIPYESESGKGYAAFIRDAQSEPFYKTLLRLAKQSVNSIGRRIGDYFRTAVPAYVPEK